MRERTQFKVDFKVSGLSDWELALPLTEMGMMEGREHQWGRSGVSF